MFQTAIAAFVGAFAALVALAEVQHPNKVIRYVIALLAGTVLAFILAFVLQWLAHIFGQV